MTTTANQQTTPAEAAARVRSFLERRATMRGVDTTAVCSLDGDEFPLLTADLNVLAQPQPQPSTVQNMLHWALGELLGALPERRDWFNPDAEKVLRAVHTGPRVAGADLDLRDLGHLFADAQQTGRPVLLSASACGVLLGAMTTPPAVVATRQLTKDEIAQFDAAMTKRGHPIRTNADGSLAGMNCYRWEGWEAAMSTFTPCVKPDTVTRESALAAIEHVEAHNGPGRAAEARAMLECDQCDGMGTYEWQGGDQTCAYCDGTGKATGSAA
jgi:hypothetical protein